MSIFNSNSQSKASGLVEVGAVWQRETKANKKPYQAISFKAGINAETLESGRELQIWPIENRKNDKMPIARLMLAPKNKEKQE